MGPVVTEKSFDQLLKDISSINRICADSRSVQPGDLFVAIPCAQQIANTAQAIANGATIIVGQAELLIHVAKQAGYQVECIAHANPRLALSFLAKSYFKVQPPTLIAVTGTNGKSSVISLVHQFWALLGLKSASFGTMGLAIDSQQLPSDLPVVPALTTYDSLSFFKLLQNLANNQINHVAFEASSHGLEQYRVHGCTLTVAGFTNLTQDHLDYHSTMESYFQAKTKLFTEVLSPGKVAVLNANSAYFERLKAMVVNPIISYGVDIPADLVALNVRAHGTYITFDLYHQAEMYHDLTLNLAGTFQIENTLCAMAMVIGAGESLAKILPLIPQLKSVNGRMELIGSTPNGADVYVDYAHTPDALERALKSLRQHTLNNLWVVFGCGGDRDRSKRSTMGKIAADLADKTIITDDNPRSEDPATIRQQIMSSSMVNASEIADRAQAIMSAVAHLAKGDTLLIAGKGHEMGQIVGDKTLPFSDKQQAKIALASLKC